MYLASSVIIPSVNFTHPNKMDVIANIFFDNNFKITNSKIIEMFNQTTNGVIIRVFCKQKKTDNIVNTIIDDNLAIFFNRKISEEEQSNFKSSIENTRLIRLIANKRVFIKTKKFFKTPTQESKKITALKIDFQLGDLHGFLLLNQNNISNIFTILGEKTSTANFEENIRYLRKTVFQKASSPPKNFANLILALPDCDIQLLLNSFLHKNIASTDMLATYIYSLDDGDILLNNLSTNIRREVHTKIRRDRITSTYRWADEVNYIINRNIFIAADTLGVTIRGLEILSNVKLSYEIFTTQHRLAINNLENRLNELKTNKQLRKLINAIDNKILAGGMSFATPNMIDNILSETISARGLQIIKEDCKFWTKQPDRQRYKLLQKFLRAINDVRYTPLLKNFPYAETIITRIHNSSAIDLIVDDLGFAPVVYALKPLPQEWVLTTLDGTIKNIYEDVINDKIKIKGFADYRIEKCKMDFLKSVLILSDEMKI